MIIRRSFALISKSGILPVEVQVNTVENNLEVIYEVPDDSFRILNTNLIPGRRYRIVDDNDNVSYLDFDDMDDDHIYMKNCIYMHLMEDNSETLYDMCKIPGMFCRIDEVAEIRECTRAEDYSYDLMMYHNGETIFGRKWSDCVNFYNEKLND